MKDNIEYHYQGNPTSLLPCQQTRSQKTGSQQLQRAVLTGNMEYLYYVPLHCMSLLNFKDIHAKDVKF